MKTKNSPQNPKCKKSIICFPNTEFPKGLRIHHLGKFPNNPLCVYCRVMQRTISQNTQPTRTGSHPVHNQPFSCPTSSSRILIQDQLKKEIQWSATSHCWNPIGRWLSRSNPSHVQTNFFALLTSSAKCKAQPFPSIDQHWWLSRAESFSGNCQFLLCTVHRLFPRALQSSSTSLYFLQKRIRVNSILPGL